MYEDYKQIERFVKDNLDYEDIAKQLIKNVYEELLKAKKEADKYNLKNIRHGK